MDSRTPWCAITRAGWPTLVTFNFSPFSNAGSASSRSSILSTDRFDAPQTSSRCGLGFAGETEVNWRMISIRVCVLPVPGGPCMHATSGASKVNLTAVFWLSLSNSSKNVMPGRGRGFEGCVMPRSTSINRVLLAPNFGSVCSQYC